MPQTPWHPGNRLPRSRLSHQSRPVGPRRAGRRPRRRRTPGERNLQVLGLAGSTGRGRADVRDLRVRREPGGYAIGTSARRTARSTARAKSRWLVNRIRLRLAYRTRSRWTTGAISLRVGESGLASACRPGPATVSGSRVRPVGPTWISVPIAGQTPQSKHGVQRQSSTSTAPAGRGLLPVLPQPVPVEARVEMVPRQHLGVVAFASGVPIHVDGLVRERLLRAAVIQRSNGEVLAPPVEAPAVEPHLLDHRPTRRSPRESRPSTMPGFPSW